MFSLHSWGEIFLSGANLTWRIIHIKKKIIWLRNVTRLKKKKNKLALITYWSKNETARILITSLHKDVDAYLNPFLEMTIRTLHMDSFGNFIGHSFSYIYIIFLMKNQNICLLSSLFSLLE